MVGKSNRTREEKARIVMEALSSTTSIAEICRGYNIGSSAFYKWRDAFIAGGTAALEPGKDRMFKEKWIEKQMGRYEHVILLE